MNTDGRRVKKEGESCYDSPKGDTFPPDHMRTVHD